MTGMSTPWGAAQTQRNIARGIIEVTTASHGGIHLSPTLNARVHQAWRDPRGWYEEDSDWAIVAVTFPQHFGEQMPPGGRHAGRTVAEAAHCVVKDYRPDQYERVFGVKVTAADSYARAEQEIAASVAGELRTTGAFDRRSGRLAVPPGYVGVAACVGGRWRRHDAEEGWFLIPESEYAGRPYPQGMLVDPDLYPEWPALPAEDIDHPVTVTMVGNLNATRPAPRVGDRYSYPLYGAAEPFGGCEVGELWQYPAAGDKPEVWRAYRRIGRDTGAWLDASPTREEALRVAGFRLPPVAEVPVWVDVAAVFAEFLAAAA